MLLSFIVPVYNVENYIRNCVDSLLLISSIDFEIILVIGKSDDGSDAICWDYQKFDQRIKVICQENTGLSDARNCGLKIAQGKYIAFIDSDDYVDSKALDKTLFYLAKNPKLDVIVSDFTRLFPNSKQSNSEQIIDSQTPILEATYLDSFLQKTGCFWNVWRYIYSKDFLVKNELWFKPNVYSEDIDYTVRVFLQKPRMAFYHNPYYFYRVRRPQSLMNCNCLKKIEDTITILSDCAECTAKSDIEQKQLIIEHMLFEWTVNLAMIYEIPAIDRKSAVLVFKEKRQILLLSKQFRYKNIYAITKFFGILPIAFLLKCLKRLRRFLIDLF